MELTGEILRGERVRQSLRLEDVAAKTKIHLRLLQAIEANRFDLLPGGLFTRSFLRQYARTLQMDEAQVVSTYQDQFPEAPPALPLPLPQKSTFARIPLFPAFGWLALTLIAGAGLYGLWQNVRRSMPEPRSASVELPPDPHSLRVESVAPAASNPAPPPHHPSPQESLAKPSAPLAAQQPAGPALPAATGPVQTPPAPTPAGNSTHVVFTAKEPVWLSIQADGKPLFSGVLEANQTKALDLSGTMAVLVGNAGGLDIAVDGKTIGPIGPHGEVRLVNLTPSGMQVSRRNPAKNPTNSNESSGPGGNH